MSKSHEAKLNRLYQTLRKVPTDNREIPPKTVTCRTKRIRKTKGRSEKRAHQANATTKEELEKTQKQAHQTNTYDPQDANTRINAATAQHELHYVTVQTNGGSYEAGLIVYNSNNCPIQGNSISPDIAFRNRLDSCATSRNSTRRINFAPEKYSSWISGSPYRIDNYGHKKLNPERPPQGCIFDAKEIQKHRK